MNRVAIAVAGAGLVGRKHVAQLLCSTKARLAAIVDPSPDAAALAASCGVPHLPTLAALDNVNGVAGVILATPTPLHFAQAMACIAKRLAVLVEKPVTDRLTDAYRLAAAADAAAVPVLVGHHRRHNPLVAAARAAVQGGDLGRIVAVQGMVLLYKPDDYFAPDWRRQPGAGPILTNLVHDIDTLRHVVGEIDAVQAITSNAIRGFAVEDSAAVLLRFANGALGTITLSDTAVAPWSWELTAAENPSYPPTGQICTLISGTDAALELPTLRLWRHDGDKSWYAPLIPQAGPALPAVDPLLVQIDHFADVIAGHASALVSVADAARTLAVLDAINQAARAGSQVSLSERTMP